MNCRNNGQLSDRSINGGTGTVTDYDEETGLICVVPDHEDGQRFRGFEEHIEIRDEQYVTLTVRFEPGQSLANR